MSRVYRDIHCKTCGIVFSPTSGSTKFCSGRCLRKNIPGILGEYPWTHLGTFSEIHECKKTGSAPLRFQIRKCEACLGPYNPSRAKQNACCEDCKSDLRRKSFIKHRAIRNNDPVAKVVRSVRCRISEIVKTKTSYRSSRTVSLIGISGQQFLGYLLSHPNNADGRFTKENYGKVWHIDHIRPLASFDLSDQKQLKEAFHYTNCQPLEAKENISKGSKWNGKRHRHNV